MGSIDFQIAALHGGSANQAAENAHVPPAPLAIPVLPARGVREAPPVRTEQDTVSLSGTPLPQWQQTSASRGNARPATFALLSQATTFPPSQSSAAAVTTSAGPPPTMQAAGQNSVPAVAATPVAQSVAGTQSTVAAATANAAGTTSPASAANTAPARKTLQQPDRLLQQLGIDPQTLSLISREGMLNWVNDPAALRQIVQDVQAAASSSQQKASVGAASPGAKHGAALDRQRQSESGPAANAKSNASPSAATAQQNATAVMQFKKLQDSLAPSGASETRPAASSGGTATRQGQLLNVSA